MQVKTGYRARRFHLHASSFFSFRCIRDCMRTVGARSHPFSDLSCAEQGGVAQKKYFFEHARVCAKCLILAASRACAFAMLQRTCSAVDSLWEYNVHASFRICGGPVKVQCTCVSHLRWTRFCFEYSALAPQKKSLLVHVTPCNLSFNFSLFCSKRHVIIRCFLIPPPPPIWSWTCLLLLTFLLSFQSVIYLYAFWLQWGVLIARDAHYNPKISLTYARMRGGVYTGKGRRLYNKDVV